MKKLEGKVAIITGGRIGIGRGIAIAMAKEGVDLCIGDRIVDNKLEKTEDELRALGVKVLICKCDVMKHHDLKKLVKATADEFGRIDILVNNACTMPMKQPFEETPLDVWEIPLKSGLEASFILMQLCFPYMKKEGGKIINMGSAAGTRGLDGLPGYCSSKAGIVGLTKAGAVEWAKYKINVNCISPFAVSEAMMKYLEMVPEEKRKEPNAVLEGMGVKMPVLGRIGDPEKDIGAAAVFLASSDSDYISGHVLPVDGGMTDLGI